MTVVRATGIALALALLTVSACGRSGAASVPRHNLPATPTGVAKWTQAAESTTPTLTPIAGHPLPTFSDWRAAYYGSDGVLHAVTLEGKTDLTGPHLPGMETAGLGFASAGIAPDGHLLAYYSDRLTIMDVTAGTSTSFEKSFAAELAWSPNGTELALSDAEGSLWIERVAGASLAAVPGTPAPNQGVGVSQLVGWIDNTHLAVTVLPANSPKYTDPFGSTFDTSIELGSIDVATGYLRIITTVSSQSLEDYRFSLSPDGSTALFYNVPYRSDPFTPIAEAISTGDGAVSTLPRIEAITASMVENAVWRPGSHTVAVTTNQLGAPTWLLDLDADSAASVPLYQSVGSVAGWSPDGTTLIFSTGYQLGVGTGPFTMSAVSLVPSGGAPRVTVLTRSAMSFPFVGFVRTA